MKIILVLFLIIVAFFILRRILKKVHALRAKDPEKKLINMDINFLTPDQKKIYEEYGKPIKIVQEESIEYDTFIWVYKEKVVKFKADGTLIKII